MKMVTCSTIKEHVTTSPQSNAQVKEKIHRNLMNPVKTVAEMQYVTGSYISSWKTGQNKNDLILVWQR